MRKIEKNEKHQDLEEKKADPKKLVEVIDEDILEDIVGGKGGPLRMSASK